MAVKTVTGKVTGPDGSAKSAAVVRALISQAAVITGTQEVVQAPVKATAAADGTFSLNLQANNDLTPTGTYYTIEETAVDGGYYTYTIQVPQTAGPFTISSLQTNPPTASPTPTHVSTMTVDGEAGIGDLSVVGLTGAANPSRYVGSTLYGAPTAGTFVAGDWIVSRMSGTVFVCTVAGTPGTWVNAGGVLDPKDYGAKGDLQAVLDVSGANGQAQITSATGLFQASDVGKAVDLYSGGIVGTQSGTILSYQSATQVTLSFNLNHAASGAVLQWATDDAAALNSWLAAGGKRAWHHLTAGANGQYFVASAGLTMPSTGARRVFGQGTLFASAALGATALLSAASVGPNWHFQDFNMGASLGFTGRFLSLTLLPEGAPGTRITGVTTFSPNDGADYHIFLDGLGDQTLENVLLNCNNQPNNKALAVNSPNSRASMAGSSPIGRIFANCQVWSMTDCTTGPLRIGNNSVRDGSGNAIATNTWRNDSCYIYGGSGAPCVQSVLVTAAGEGAAGGAFPNITSDASYYIFGNDATGKAFTGSLNTSFGSTDITFGGGGFVQPAASAVISINPLIEITGGAGSVVLVGTNGSIKSAVTTAKIFNASAGTSDCVVTDYMQSGVTTKWEHPGLSNLSPGPVPLTMGASPFVITNTFAMPEDIWIQTPVNSAITLIRFSSNYGTSWQQMWTDNTRSVTDGVTTNASPTVTSASAAWTQADVGRSITGAGIPVNTYIKSVESATSITMNKNATASASGVTLTISGEAVHQPVIHRIPVGTAWEYTWVGVAPTYLLVSCL